jgi:signal peptidase II
VCNQGAGFSFTPGSPLFNRIFFSVISVAAIAVLTVLIHRETRTLPLLSFALIIGGAAGNLVDRVVHGGVTDFIDADFPDFIMERWPVFNVADSSILIGICLYLVFSLIIDRHTKNGDAEHETTA